ncbi:hypothetical protein ENBRE01_0787 [Enteropsectra breve]|nr:hypothetical protein ENBRE01_0787 [Enteropsectra breve]
MGSICDLKNCLHKDQYTYENIYELSLLHNLHSMDQILTFYLANRDTVLLLEDKTTSSLPEVFCYSNELLEAMDSEFYSLVLLDSFITRNNLELATFTDVNSVLQDSQYQDPTQQMKTAAKCLRAYIEANEEKFIFKLVPSEKELRCVEDGYLPPMMYLLKDELKLTKNTFKYLITKEIDVPSLMAMELSDEMHEPLYIRLHSDKKFASKCKNYISEQEVINTTAYIISVFLNLELSGKNIDYNIIDRIFCCKHTEALNIPFSHFKDLMEVTKQEIYLLYLHSKRNIAGDLKELDILFSDEKIHNEIVSSSMQEGCFNDDFSGTNIESQLPLMSPIVKEPSLCLSPSINALVQILDLALAQGLNIRPGPVLLSLLHYLDKKEYFDKIYDKYAKEIVRNSILIPSKIEAHKNIERVLEYIDKNDHISEPLGASHKLFKKNKCVDACSFDTIDDELLLTSLDDKDKNAQKEDYSGVNSEKELSANIAVTEPEAALPLLNFTRHTWLERAQRVLLMRHYILNYDANQLTENYLISCSHAEVDAFFKANYNSIRDKCSKLATMARLGIDITTESATIKDVAAAIEMVDDVYPFRDVVCQGKVHKRFIAKLIINLTPQKVDALNHKVLTEELSPSFILQYLAYICKEYEFSHIFRILEHVLENYNLNIALAVQKYIMELAQDPFFIEEYFNLVEGLYKKLLKFRDLKIIENNEKILELIVECGKDLDKNIFIGNLK